MNNANPALSIARYYRAMAKAWLGGLPITDDDLHAWCHKQLVLLWNEPSMLGQTLGQFITASSEPGRSLKRAGAMAPPLVLAIFLLWPLIALARSRRRSASQWWQTWRVALRRPDLIT